MTSGPAIEEWRHVVGWPYEVSSLGRVRSVDRPLPPMPKGGVGVRRGKVLAQHSDKDGYKKVSMWNARRRVTVRVHQLVAAAFLLPSDLPEVNHKDGRKANNVPDNLEWIDRSGNMKHAFDMGLFDGSENLKNWRPVAVC